MMTLWVKLCNLFRPRSRKVNPYLSQSDWARQLWALEKAREERLRLSRKGF